MSAEANEPPKAQEPAATEQQPPRTSGGREAAEEHEETVRNGYDAAQEPERQGDGDPGPDRDPQQPS